MKQEIKNRKFSLDLKKATATGADKIKKGAAIAKSGIVKGAAATKDGVIKGTAFVQEKSKTAQVAVLNYIDTQKNKRFLEAKLSAFEDGLKEGKVQAADYIKKYANYCLAITALSYYFARCDGTIDEAEMLEIQYDLDSILKNKDLPDALKNEMYEISENSGLTFDKVRKYLDGIGIETLLEFKNDIDEIILADGDISPEEAEAKENFYAYLQCRMGEGTNE